MSETRAPSFQAWWAVIVLSFANAVSYLDRQILVLLIEPIKHDLRIGDAAFGLLQGFSFALFYALLGLPIAVLADRGSRVAIIRIGCLAWSAATILCGAASSYIGLFAARIGVGGGEAALNPAATSLLADRFPGPSRSVAMSTFVLGASLGAGLALMVGGRIIGAMPRSIELPVLGRTENWQLAFIACGAIGLVTLVLLTTVSEPVRSVDEADQRKPQADSTLRMYEVPLLIGGFGLLATMSFGVGSWLPALFMRRFEFDASEVGQVYGSLVMITAPLGVLSGGWLGLLLAKRSGRDGPLTGAIIGGILLTAVSAAPALVHSYHWTLAVAALFNFAAPLPFGLAYTCLADRTPTTHRARQVAIYGLTLNLLGYGLGPLAIGLMTEWIFGEQGVASAMIVLASVAGPAGLALLSAAKVRGRIKSNQLIGHAQ